MSQLLSDELWDLQGLIATATPLWERFRPGRSPSPGAIAESVRIQLRKDRWQSVMGGGIALKRRLTPGAIGSLDPLLGDRVSFADHLDIPDWASTIEQVLDKLRHPGASQVLGADPTHPNRALPFEEVFQPFLSVAADRLLKKADGHLKVLAPLAKCTLEHQLSAHLSFVANLTLAEDFSLFCFQRAPAYAFHDLWNQTETSTQLYDEYVKQLLNGRLGSLFQRKPVLARLLGQSVNQWISSVANLCNRFILDFRLLRDKFNWGSMSPDSAVAMVRTDISDRHWGGQTVLELILQCGSRIVYKPRSVKAEEVFYLFLSQLATERLSLPLHILSFIDRTTYGWCEVARWEPCHSAEGITRFYRRAGMLLAVLHLLSITDIHCENVIAFGEQPVVVDLETMLNGWVSADRPWSVINTGFLPRWQTAPNGHAFDMSGLCADEAQDAGIPRRAWRKLNTDQMHLSDGTSARASMSHRPTFENRVASVRDHVSELTAGFEEMYSHLLERRTTLLNNVSLLEAFNDLDIRVLLRGTATYTRLQLRLLHPEFMSCGVDRSIELEWLARPLSGPNPRKIDRDRIYRHELDAMEKLDVPVFTSASSPVRHGEFSDPDLQLLCARRDASVVRERLFQMSQADCDKQVEIMKQAIRDRFAEFSG